MCSGRSLGIYRVGSSTWRSAVVYVRVDFVFVVSKAIVRDSGVLETWCWHMCEALDVLCLRSWRSSIVSTGAAVDE